MKSDNILDTIRDKLDVFLKDKVDSVIVVDISSKLTLLNVQLKGKIEVTALKIVELDLTKRNEVVLNSLRSFIQENNITPKYAILKPSLSSLLIKRIQLPSVPDNELKEAIKWQLKEDVSFDLSEAVLDFSIIKKTENNDGSKVLDIMCALAQELEIKLQVMPLKQLGLTCLAVGLMPFSYEGLVEKCLKPKNDTAIGILHLSEDVCCFNIYKDNKLDFYRELPISINQLQSSLRGTLVSDKGKIELSAKEAEEVLFTIGVPQQDCNYQDKMNSTQILSLIRPMLERLAVEIKRSLAYYSSHFEGGVVDKIVIAGRGVSIKNIDDFLNKELSLIIQKISPGDGISVSSNVVSEAFSQSYSSLGLVLDYKNSINLLPHEFRTEKIEKFQKVSLRWSAFIAFLLLAVSFVFARAGIGFFQKRVDNAKVHLGVMSEVVQIKQKAEQLNNFVAEIRNSEIPMGSMLKKLSNIAPRELFINNFSFDYEANAGTVKGYIKSYDKNPDIILTKFISDLKDSVYFSEVRITSVTKNEDRGFEITEFQVEFKLF